MFQLICSLLAIAMMSGTLFATVSYLDPAAVQASNMAQRLERSFVDLKSGYEAFVQINNTQPDTLAAITPDYAFLPPAPIATQWSFGTLPDGGGGNNGNGNNGNGNNKSGGGGGRYFCLSGEFTAVAVLAIRRLRDAFSPQAFFINTTCGAMTHAPPPAGAGAYTGAVTLWVAPY